MVGFRGISILCGANRVKFLLFRMCQYFSIPHKCVMSLSREVGSAGGEFRQVDYPLSVDSYNKSSSFYSGTYFKVVILRAWSWARQHWCPWDRLEFQILRPADSNSGWGRGESQGTVFEPVHWWFWCTAKPENRRSTEINLILRPFVNLCSRNFLSIYCVLYMQEIKTSQDHLRPLSYLGREFVGVGERRERMIGERKDERHTINPK